MQSSSTTSRDEIGSPTVPRYRVASALGAQQRSGGVVQLASPSAVHSCIDPMPVSSCIRDPRHPRARAPHAGLKTKSPCPCTLRSGQSVPATEHCGRRPGASYFVSAAHLHGACHNHSHTRSAGTHAATHPHCPPCSHNTREAPALCHNRPGVSLLARHSGSCD